MINSLSGNMNDNDGVLYAFLLWFMMCCCDGWDGCNVFFEALAAFSLVFALKDQCRHSSLGKLIHRAMFRVILLLCIMNAMLPCCDAVVSVSSFAFVVSSE